MTDLKRITGTITLNYDFGDEYHDCEYEYECEYTLKDYVDYICDCMGKCDYDYATVEKVIYALYYNDSLGEFDNPDDCFKEFLTDAYRDDAYYEMEHWYDDDPTNV